MPPDGYDSN